MTHISVRSVPPNRCARAGRADAGALLLAVLFILVALGAAWAVPAAGQEERPTVDQPVVVSVDPADATVAPGERSALLVTFRVPKFMWLGAHPSEDRTPPGTKVAVEDVSGLSFEEPVYPEPSVEGVPVHLGVTRVYQGEVRIVVPFRVAEGASAGERGVTVRVTYTPGFNAGSLSTHVDEPYSTTVRVERGARAGEGLPQPGVAEVSNDFVVQRAEFSFPSFLGPMGHEYRESAFTSALHTLFQDPPGHQKTIRHMTYPFVTSTNQSGNSFGGGMAFLNSTREGVMTGALSLLAYDNEFVGTTFGIDYITCPAAYKNLRISARASPEDYQEVRVQWEDFTLGENDRWGFQVDARAETDPRTRFYGLGPDTEESDVSVYDHSELGANVDFYHLPVNNFRIGIGYKIRSVSPGRGIEITDLGFDRIPFTEERFAGVVGLEGSTTMGGRLNLIYDARNQEFTPSKGFFAKLTAEFDRTVDDYGPDGALEDDYGRFNLDVRQYFSTTDQRLSVLLRGQATFTTSEDIPFYEQASLGGPGSLRAFDRNRFYGQHAAFASASVRYTVLKLTMMGFPMEMVVSPFLDVGQVFDDGFGDELAVDPGASLRFVNPPNVGYVLNVAEGRDGVNVTGGISLPF